MARVEETPFFPNAYAADREESAGCGCFGRFCGGEGSLILEKLKKLRELTEVAAGPKWKNLVRKLGRICNPRRPYERTAATEFQYSPQSYALNFAGDDAQEDGGLMHSFSTRFAQGFSVNNQQRNTGL